jgi:hypothetical protein
VRAGDGDAFACRKLAWGLPVLTVLEKQIALAVGLFFVGLLAVWATIYGAYGVQCV